MVEGVPALKRRFSRFTTNIREEVSKQLEKEAEKIVSVMRALAPIKDGDLVASIGWTWGDAPAGSVTLGAVRGNEFEQLRITIFAGGTGKTSRTQNRASGSRKSDQGREGSFESDNAFYQEFGTLKMPANPFFFPAWRSERARVKANLNIAVRRAIKKS
jgi:hypothetical protein